MFCYREHQRVTNERETSTVFTKPVCDVQPAIGRHPTTPRDLTPNRLIAGVALSPRARSARCARLREKRVISERLSLQRRSPQGLTRANELIGFDGRWADIKGVARTYDDP